MDATETPIRSFDRQEPRRLPDDKSAKYDERLESSARELLRGDHNTTATMPGILPMKVIKVGTSAQSRIAQACDRCRSKKVGTHTQPGPKNAF